MKKLLLALGLTAFFGFAQAQSSVTVYGILDMGYIGTNMKGTSISATTAQNTNTFGDNAETASRLGFNGSEDLGSGTSAFFTLETGLNGANSTLSTFNNRQTFVGLKQTGLGQVAVGTQYTPIFVAAAVTDPGELNNMVGNAVFAQSPQNNGNSGSTPYPQGAGTSSTTNSSGNSSDGFTVRVANALTATSDKFNGFSVTGLVTANNQNSTQTSATAGGQNNSNGWGLGANYEWGKLFVTANYQALKNVTTGTVTSPTPSVWNTASGDVNTHDNQTYVAGTYNFGILKAYAQYINRHVTDSIDSSYFGNRQAEQVGVRGFITPRIEGWASAGMGKLTAFGQGQPTANFTTYQLGSNYWFSKRTNLYAIFGSTQTSSTASVTTPGNSANAYALGMRHTF
jgi:predicted porin